MHRPRRKYPSKKGNMRDLRELVLTNSRDKRNEVRRRSIVADAISIVDEKSNKQTNKSIITSKSLTPL